MKIPIHSLMMATSLLVLNLPTHLFGQMGVAREPVPESSKKAVVRTKQNILDWIVPLPVRTTSSPSSRLPTAQATGGGPGRTVFESFDVPGSEGTYPDDINVLGSIVGEYIDATSAPHLFVRDPTGTINSFDVPGAARYGALAINDFGTIAGSYLDERQAEHGFIRLNDCSSKLPANCTITVVDIPGAVPRRRTGTAIFGINAAGTVVGSYPDSFGSSHGFVRTANGVVTIFDVPGVVAGNHAGTFPESINSESAVTGFYSSLNSNSASGFVRAPGGKINTFTSPNYAFLTPELINDTGEIAGYVNDPNGNTRGFVRSVSGSLKIYDAGPYTASSCCTFTNPSGINTFGTIVGSYSDLNGLSKGYQLTPDGSISTFEFPGAGTGAYQGTYPNAINLDAMITGSYTDANYVSHGFVYFARNTP